MSSVIAEGARFFGDSRPSSVFLPSWLRYMRMTATAALYTSSGFAIAADGRRSWKYAATTVSREGVSDSVQKIFQLVSSGGVFAYCIRGATVNENLSWDIATELAAGASSVRSKQFSSAKKYLGALCGDLAMRMESAKTVGILDGFPTSEISFLGYFHSRPCWIEAQFRPVNGRLFYRLVAQECEPGCHLVSGSEVLDRMIRDCDYRMRHLFEGFNGEDTPLGKAVESVTQYIQACCSTLIRGLDPDSEKRIGGQIHVAIVTPDSRRLLSRLLDRRQEEKGGFEWIVPPISRVSSVP